MVYQSDHQTSFLARLRYALREPSVTSVLSEKLKELRADFGSKPIQEDTYDDPAPARMRTLRKKEWVINPDTSKFIARWDVVTAIALIFVACATPLEVGLMELRLDTLFWTNRIVDLIFAIDMVLQFFLMYPVKTHYGRRLEHRHSYIVNHYLRRWFVIDFVTLLPLDTIGLLLHSSTVRTAILVKLVRLLRLVKLVRALRASRQLRRIEVRVSITYQKMSLLKFTVMLVWVAHCQACGWGLTLHLVTADERTPRWIDSVTANEENVMLKTKDSVWKLYVAAAYFSAKSMIGVGCGDLAPQNILERCFCIVMLVVSGVLWAFIIGQVANIVATMDRHEKQQRQTMDDLNFMLKDRSVPQELCCRARRYFLGTRDAHRYARHRTLIEKMSPVLQGEVAFRANAMWLEKVSFLRESIGDSHRNLNASRSLGAAPRYVIDIALALETHMYTQGEVFGRPAVLYILNRGIVSRQTKMLHSSGTCVWGEDFVLHDPTLRELNTTICLTYVEVSCLPRAAFMTILETHRQVYYRLDKCVNSFRVRLAARRGILREARIRKALLQSGGIRDPQTRLGDDEQQQQLLRRLASHASVELCYAKKDTDRLWLKTHDDTTSLEEVTALRQEISNLRGLQDRTTKILEQLTTGLPEKPTSAAVSTNCDGHFDVSLMGDVVEVRSLMSEMRSVTPPTPDYFDLDTPRW